MRHDPRSVVAFSLGALVLLAGGWALSPHRIADLLLVAAGISAGLGLARFISALKPNLPVPEPAPAVPETPVARLDSVTQELQEGVLELYTLIELSRMI